jgi:hypothetical protein
MAMISKPQLDLLRRAHEETIHVFYNPGTPGSGINEKTMQSLRRAGLLTLGRYEVLKGYPLTVTTKGVALLVHFGQIAASPTEEGSTDG